MQQFFFSESEIKTAVTNLLSPRAFDKLRIKNLLPAMQTLYLCPIMEEFSCINRNR